MLNIKNMSAQEISVAIKNRILLEFARDDRNGLYATMQKIMAYNSNRIEGSQLSSEQTASLFDTGTIVSNGIETYHSKDIEETTGHFKMFNVMLKKIDEPLTESLIKTFHFHLKNGVYEDFANGYPVGEYKNRANRVGTTITALPEDVPTLMKDLLSEYNASKRSIEDIACFHAKYEHIHPFQDGNGRTGRMIILKQCFDSGLIPIIVHNKDRSIYMRALHLSQEDEKCSELVSFFVDCQQKFLEEIPDFLRDFEKVKVSDISKPRSTHKPCL